MSDVVASWIRTVVPGAWAALVGIALAWAGTHAPWLVSTLEVLGVDLTSPTVVAGVVLAVLALWHALWRKIEPHLPPWLTRLVLGLNRTPSYAGVTADGVDVVTTLPAYTLGERVRVVASGSAGRVVAVHKARAPLEYAVSLDLVPMGGPYMYREHELEPEHAIDASR